MSLSQRPNNLQTGAYADQLAEFRQLTWEQMCNTKIDFGKAQAGKTYLQLWHNEVTWVRWFVKAYESSGKVEHMKFLTFVELMVEMEEKGMTPTPVETAASHAPMQAPIWPKAQDLLVNLEEPDVEEWMGMPSVEPTEMIDALQARMTNLENAMTEILGHIRRKQS